MKTLNRNLVKLLLIIFIMGLVLTLTPYLSVKAVSPFLSISKADSQDRTNILNLEESIRKELGKEFGQNHKIVNYFDATDILTGGAFYNIEIVVDIDNYSAMSMSNREKVMNIVLPIIRDSKVSSTNRNKIYNFIAQTDTPVSSLIKQLGDNVKPDYYKAYSYFRPFQGGIGTILGFVAILIMALLAFTMVMDLAYINIPGFQWMIDKGKVKLEEKTEKGTMAARGKSLLVSNEAKAAVELSLQNNGTGASVMGIYFKSKVKQLVMLAICLLYLISGQIYTLVASIVDAFNNFVTTLK